MPTVDVLVPCYNYGRYLRDCVASVLAQEGCDVRVLVIDDASTDGSAAIAHAIAAEDRRVEVVAHARNEGHIATYNEGIARSSADHFLLLSADDMLLPGALARAVAVMQQHPEVCWTYGREVELHPGETLPAALARASSAQESPPWRITPGAEFIGQLCRSGFNHVPTCTVVVRGAAQRAVGGYRPELPHSGDLDMWLRLSTLGAVAETGIAQGVRRFHAANMAKTYPDVRDLRQRRAAFESFLTHDAAALPEAVRWRRDAWSGLAADAARRGLQHLRRGRLRSGLACLGFAFRHDARAVPAAPLAYLARRWANRDGTRIGMAQP